MSDLLIKINADASNAKQAFDDMKDKTEELEQSLNTVAKYSAVAFAALSAEVVLATHAFQDATQSSTQLTLTLQNQGIYSEALLESYKGQAEALQALTGFDDDAIIKGQALLQNFIGQKEVTEELSKAAIELAQAQGGDVAAGFETLGRAINGNSRVLKQFGITIDENLSKSERQARIIELVNLKLGGQAEAANKAGGGMRLLLASVSDVQEELGQRFAPLVAKGISLVTDFLIAFKKNEGLINLTAGLIGAATAVTGLIAVAAGIAPVFIAANAAAAAFGVTTAAILAPVAGVALAVAALGAAVGIYVANSGKAATATDELTKQIKFQTNEIERLQNVMKNPISRFFTPDVEKQLDDAKLKLALLEEEKRKFESQSRERKESTDVDPAKKAQADKEAEFQRQQDERKQAANKAHIEVMKLENQHASEELIAIKREEAQILDEMSREENEQKLALLQERYEQKVALETEQREQDKERDAAWREENAALEEELHQRDIDAKSVLRAQDRQQLEADLLTEKEAERKVAIDIAAERAKRRNDELLDRKRYGAAIATINATLHSEEVQGVKRATAELVELQNSRNATLKTIGKAAAIAQITIKTAETAVNVYNGFSVIPIIGPALGIAAAAAAIAYGIEQIGRVNAAKEGGLVTGGIPGVDSVPILAEPGELIVPSKLTPSFLDVVGGKTATPFADGGGSSNGETLAVLRSIDQKLTQPSQTIIQGDVMADETFIDVLVSKINERVRYGNAVLTASEVQ